jgi:hypothetical protein
MLDVSKFIQIVLTDFSKRQNYGANNNLFLNSKDEQNGGILAGRQKVDTVIHSTKRILLLPVP